MTVTNRGFERVPADICAAAAKHGTATLHEAAGQIGALPAAIKPVVPSFHISGPALTVQGPPVDNLWIHRGIAIAEPGDVLVVSVSGAFEAGYWGEIMSTVAKTFGLGGLVIDGCVRDGHLLEGIGFPVFARGLCIRGTGKDMQGRGSLLAPVLIGDVVVNSGDLVVGDGDGVVVLPRERAEAVVAASIEREKKEAETIEMIRKGNTTVAIYNWGMGDW